MPRVLGLLGIVLTLAQVSAQPRQPGADAALWPPDLEESVSPSGTHLLEVRLRPSANAHVARSTATLYQIDSSTRRAQWTRELPHRPRPRFLVVADGGQVVLLDEWLNVRSELAVVVISPDNRTVARFDLEAVRAALGVPIGALAPLARHGVWIQGPPIISALGDAVEVAAGGRVLTIKLSDGTLSAR